MLQKKRDEFRKEIRRQQINKIIEKKRKELMEHVLNNDIFYQIKQIFEEISSCLNAIAEKKYDHEKSSLLSHMQEKEFNIEHKEDQENFYVIMNDFHKLKSLSPYDYEQIFTKFMMDKESADIVLKILNDVIENEWDLNEEKNEWLVDSLNKKYSEVVRDKVIIEVIKFLDTLVLMVIGYDNARSIIDSVWNLLTDGNDALFNPTNNYECLKYTLSILSKYLVDRENPLAYQHMEQKGLASQLVKFIGRIKKLSLPLEIHENLLHLIDNYLNLEINQIPQIRSSEKIGEITIQTSKVNGKELFLTYCISFIDKSEESLYSIVFACISKILEINEFLVDNLKEEYWKKVCDLVLHENREIQVEALNLLNDFCYHSQRVLDFLLSKYELFDRLYKRLMIEKTSHDHFVMSCVEKIAYIICNSLLTDDLKIKKSCLDHFIWEEIFNSLNPSSQLFPLIMTMSYFFIARGHKNFDKYFRPYVETLRNFEWQNCRYSESIKDSIMQTFYSASQQWQEHEYILFLTILQQEGLLFMVEEFVEESDEAKIKDIEIE